MSEAVQRPNQNNPEGYSPKNKPEILKMMEQKTAPTTSETNRSIASDGEPPRLSDIRPLIDGMKGHNYALPDCIKFILERVGGHKDLCFWNIAALSGDTVAQVYNRNPAFGCEYCVSGYLSGPEHIAYIFDVLGYDHEYVTAKQFNANTAYYLRKIAIYLNNGIPVLVKTNLNDIPAWNSDVGTHCLIVGYKPDKNTLELLVSGTKPIEYEITDENKLDLIFIGEKRREVSREEVYQSIIKRMPYWLTLPECDGLYFGPAAYRAWADDIEQGRFTQEGLPLWENYGVYVCNLATNGDFAMFHLRELAEMNPLYSDFLRLNAEILKLMPTENPDGSGKNLLWVQLEKLRGGMDMNAVRETMRNHEKRSKVAAVLREYAKHFDQVIELLTEQIPQGYSPKERPEILKMAEENAVKCGTQQVNRVKTVNGGNYIDGVPMLQWGEWKDNTYCGCVTALLNAAGISVSYEEVMGLSGVCLQAIMRGDWDPSSQMPQNGLLYEKNVGDALGVDVYTVKEEKELSEHAKKSIDAGVPVLLVGGRWEPEWTLACGYAVENIENKFYGRTYFDYQGDSVSENEIYTDNRYFAQSGFPGVFPAGLTRFYDRKKEPISRKEALKVSLQTCIKMFEQKPGEHHKFGYDAYDVLIAGFELGEEEYRAKCRNDQYHIGSLTDARRAAAVYLESSAGLLDGENAQKLAETARIFQVMLDNLLGAVPYEKTTGVFNTCSDPVWETERRQNLVRALKANKGLERLAREKIAEILANLE